MKVSLSPQNPRGGWGGGVSRPVFFLHIPKHSSLSSKYVRSIGSREASCGIDPPPPDHRRGNLPRLFSRETEQNSVATSRTKEIASPFFSFFSFGSREIKKSNKSLPPHLNSLCVILLLSAVQHLLRDTGKERKVSCFRTDRKASSIFLERFFVLLRAKHIYMFRNVYLPGFSRYSGRGRAENM